MSRVRVSVQCASVCWSQDVLCKNGWTNCDTVLWLTHVGPFTVARGEKLVMRLLLWTYIHTLDIHNNNWYHKTSTIIWYVCHAISTSFFWYEIEFYSTLESGNHMIVIVTSDWSLRVTVVCLTLMVLKVGLITSSAWKEMTYKIDNSYSKKIISMWVNQKCNVLFVVFNY